MPWTNSRKYCIWGISTRFNFDGVFKKENYVNPFPTHSL